MSSHSHSVKPYLMVFAALLILTGVTVGVSYLHLSVVGAVAVALLVASIKGTLVATKFMHLIGENRWVYFTLALTVFFFLFLMIVPTLVTSTDYRL